MKKTMKTTNAGGTMTRKLARWLAARDHATDADSAT